MGPILSRISSLFDSYAQSPARVVMLGLDAAGKTTVMYKLKLNETVNTIPTVGFNVETLQPKKGLTITMWDVGGQDKIRALWRYYFQNAEALGYVVDSCDRARFGESLEELTGILEAPEMERVPVVVLANKQDLPRAASCSEVTEALQLNKLQNRKWHVQGTTALNGEGLYEAMDKMGELIKDFKKYQAF